MAIRRESVELSLNDVDFTTGMAKAAASTAILNRELGNLDGSSNKANRSTSSLGDGNGGIAKVGKQARQSSSDIDKYSGRLGLLTKSVLALGPALVPISAAAIPAVSGLAMGFGAAAGAAGVAVLAFNGVGDAVKAMDAYALTPTAANLAKMQQAMQNLGPAGANFARFIDGLEPQLRALQGSAREGLFPGVQQGIEELLPMLPKVEDFIGRIASEMGNLAAEAGKGLTGDAGFQKFAHYIDAEGVPIMDAFATSTGKVASGMVALAADMAPLTGDFMGGMANAADSFQKWAVGLDQTQGFRDFVSYIEQEGLQVVDLLKTIASTALSIAEAFAPIGSVTLPALTAVAKVIGLIANSPLGPVVATVISLNAAIGLGSLAVDKLAASWGRVALAAGGAAAAERTASITGVGSLLAASPVVAGVRSGARAAGGAGLAAYLGAHVVGSGYGLLAQKINPSNNDFGSQSSINNVVGSLQNGWGSGSVKKALDPLAWAGFNPAGWGDKKPVQNADSALSQMAGSGQGAQAAADFQKIADAAKKAGISVDDVKAKFPQYTAALKDADAANKAGADSTTHLSTSAKGLSAQFREGTISLNQFRAGLASVHQEALNDFDAVTQFGAAVQAAAKQARDGAKAGLNPFTAAGNANRQAISGMVAAWNAQPAAIQNNIGKYQQMKSKLAEFMGQMGATKAQIRDLTNEINKPKKLVVKADTTDTIPKITSIRDLIEGLHDKTVTLTTREINQGIGNAARNSEHSGGFTPQANGGSVPKDGGAYADRYHYLLAPGEEVISNRNGQADRFRPLLKAINAGRLADGGTARPIFRGEGPRFYDAALAHNILFTRPPSDWDWPWQTGLTARQERRFEHWVSANHVPFDVGANRVDYDMRGYWLKTKGKGWHEGSHFPDTFKTPYDTTFSHESKYATKNNPFYWHGDKLVDQRNGQVVFAANGGFIAGAGGPRDDKIPARLSNGEFVVNAATTARLRPWLEHENAKGYAKGGYVGGDAWAGYSRNEMKVVDSATKLTRGLDDLSSATKKQTQASVDSIKKAIDAQKQLVQTEQAHTQAIRDSIASVSQSTADRFRGDQLGSVSQSANQDRYSSDPATAQAGWEAYWAAHPGRTVTSRAMDATDEVKASIAAMQKDTSDARTFDASLAKVRAELRQGGVKKGQIDQTLAYLSQSGSVSQAQALAGSSQLAMQFQQVYGQRQQVTAQLGQHVALAQYGDTLARSEKHQAAAVKELVSLKAQVHKLEAAVKQSAKDTGAEVGSKINKAVVTAGKGRTP